MLHLLKGWFETFALKGDGYQFWSGIGSGSPILAGVFLAVRHKNCHVKGCWRLGHPDPEHGHPVCHRHQSKLDLVRGSGG